MELLAILYIESFFSFFFYCMETPPIHLLAFDLSDGE